MKAEERHKLHTNELAESLAELPQQIRAHGRSIITAVLALLIVGTAVLWWRHSKTAAATRRADTFQQLLQQAEQMQMLAMQLASQDPASGAQLYGQQYDPAGLADSLGKLAADAAGTPLGAAALAYQAEVVRSELLLAPSSDEQTAQATCQRAEALYQRVLADYPQHTPQVGMAQLGLGLLAEQTRQWDTARQIYDQIVAQADDKFAGTAWPQLARRRLAMLDDLAEPIHFAPTPEPPALDMTMTAPALGPLPPADQTGVTAPAPADVTTPPAIPESANPPEQADVTLPAPAQPTEQ